MSHGGVGLGVLRKLSVGPPLILFLFFESKQVIWPLFKELFMFLMGKIKEASTLLLTIDNVN